MLLALPLLLHLLLVLAAASSENKTNSSLFLPPSKPRTEIELSILYASTSVLQQTLPPTTWPTIDWYLRRAGRFSYSNITEPPNYYLHSTIWLSPTENTREVFLALYVAYFYSQAIVFTSLLNYKMMDSIASFTTGLSVETPVVSLIPLHNWQAEAYKAPYVLIPQFGQRFRGRVALHLILAGKGQNDNLKLRKILIFKENAISSILKDFYDEEASLFEVLPVKDVFVSLDNLERVSHDLAVETPYPDVMIVDCSLEIFSKLAPLLLEQNVLTNETLLLFFHDYLEINLWGGLELLWNYNITVYIFGQCRLEWESCQTDSDISKNQTHRTFEPEIYGALFHDLLELALEAGEASDYDPSNYSYFNLSIPWVCDQTPESLGEYYLLYYYSYYDYYYYEELESYRYTMQIWYQHDGDKLLNALKSNCFSGKAGTLAFSEETIAKCIDISAVAVLPLRLTDVYQNTSEIHTRSTWRVDGRWTQSEGLRLAPRITVFPERIRDVEEESVLKVIAKHDSLFLYTSEEDDRDVRGVDADLINFIALSAGFSRIEYTLWNQSDVGMLEALRDRHDWDMAAGAIAAVPDTANFTRFYHYSSVGIIALQSQETVSLDYMWNFMDPFQWTVWLSILAMLIISAFVAKWLHLAESLPDSLWLSFCTVFFMNENRLVMTNSFGRIYIIALLFVIVVLISSYTANMVSFLTSEPATIDFNLLFYRRRPVAAGNEFGELTWLERSGMRDIVPVTGDEEAVSLLLNNSVDAYVADVHLVDRLATTYCNLTVVQRSLFKRQFAFAIHYRFSEKYGKAVDDAIVQAVNSRQVSDWLQNHTEMRSPLVGCESDRGSSEKQLGLNNVGGVFVIAASGAALCVVIKMTQRVVCKKSKMRVQPGYNSARSKY